MAGIGALAVMIVAAGILGLRAASRERRARDERRRSSVLVEIPPMGTFYAPYSA